MIYLIIIQPKTELINIAQCFHYETDEYSFFPDKEGNPISFATKEEAEDWLKANIKDELISPEYKSSSITFIREKYLK